MSAQTYQVGAHFKAQNEPILVAASKTFKNLSISVGNEIPKTLMILLLQVHKSSCKDSSSGSRDDKNDDKSNGLKSSSRSVLGLDKPRQVWSLSSFKVSRQVLMTDLNQVSSVSLLITASVALANEGLFELTRA